MHSRGQFSRGGGEGGGNYRRGRRYQYVRSRVSPTRAQQQPQPQTQQQQQQQLLLPQQNHHQHHQQVQLQPQQQRRQRNSIQSEMDEFREICAKLTDELKSVKDSLVEITATLDQFHLAGDKRRKSKLVKKPSATTGLVPSVPAAIPAGVAGDTKKPAKPRRINRRDRKPNDDSTTQAADPSSEDKNDADDAERHRVYRRKKQHFGRRNNRRRRVDSSNDTSPQNEANGDDYRTNKKIYPQLSESDLNDLVQRVTRDFLAGETQPVKKLIEEKGPALAREFASSILDHAICDVTSPTKLNDIATTMFQIISCDNGMIQEGFYQALGDVSNREDDIAIDAPRYMDTLGQVLGQCVAPMNTGRHRNLMKRFLLRCLASYSQKSRADLLASIMKGIANYKSERQAKEIWDYANLRWDAYLAEDRDLDEYLESKLVQFTTKTFSPEPRKSRKTPEDLKKFADDVTDLVERQCTTSSLEDLVKNLELEADEKVEYIATLIYGIVRGCLSTESGDYKLNSDALAKYSSLLNGMQKQEQKKEQDAIALQALTALTKLWHQHNCPQNLMSTILLALHGHGAASYDSLKTWLNSDDLKNTPGIGAARLTSKRCIDDLGGVRG